jgi:hypothetical protein
MAIHRTHTSVLARREDKMSHTQPGYFYGPVYLNDGKWKMEFIEYTLSSNQRDVLKRSSNAKRRRRDRQETLDY